MAEIEQPEREIEKRLHAIHAAAADLHMLAGAISRRKHGDHVGRWCERIRLIEGNLRASRHALGRRAP